MLQAVSPTEPGFTDPVQQSQRAFRAVLDAFARPGRAIEMDLDLNPPSPLCPALAAAALCLLDLDTRVWLGPGFAESSAGDWLRFHTGTALTSAPGHADFVLLDARHPLPPFDAFAWGSDEAPEQGATLLIQTAALDGPAAFRATGPGIKEAAVLPDLCVAASFWAARIQACEAFPRGVDLLFGAGGRLIGLPRSTRLTALET